MAILESFSIPHTLAYSIEALQEANLATRYNPLFWDCACLSVNAGSSSTNMEENFSDGDESDSLSTESEEIAASSSINYAKTSRAITEIQQHGVIVAPPDINRAEFDFYPDIEHNRILCSLLVVTGVNPDLASTIIANRPYTSIHDFVERVNPTTVQMINIIKAGCFDELLYYAGKDRPFIMREYLELLAENSVQRKTKLTAANLEKGIVMDIIPKELDFGRRVFRFKKWMKQNAYDKENRRYLVNHPSSLKFFKQYLEEDLTLGKDYDTIPDGYCIKGTMFNKLCDGYMSDLKKWLASEEALDTFYEAEKREKFQSVWNKYCGGSVSRWEMQSLHYYYHEHELKRVNTKKYNIKSFESLPDAPVIVGTKTNKDGREYQIYDTCCICGTVTNADNNKHIVTIITNYGEVVDIKFPATQYIYYNKVVSVIDENGKKTVLDPSWFNRNEKILVSGFRRELSFVPKANYEKGQRYAVQLITDMDASGNLSLISERVK